MSTKRIFSYGEINELYRVHYDPRPFTDFEVHLFNGDIKSIDIATYKDDIEKIYSLSNYFSINNDNKNYLKCVNILLSGGDIRGFNKLGIYLLKNNNKENTIKVFSVGASKGSVHCMANLGEIYLNQKDYDTALPYYMEALKNGNYDVLSRIGQIYFIKNEFAKGCKFLTQGILNGDKKCMKLFELCLERDEMYLFLIKLKTTNVLIQEKIKELHRTIDIGRIEQDMHKELLFMTVNGQLLNLDFETVLDLKEITTIHTMEDIFDLIHSELEKTPEKVHDDL